MTVRGGLEPLLFAKILTGFFSLLLAYLIMNIISMYSHYDRYLEQIKENEEGFIRSTIYVFGGLGPYAVKSERNWKRSIAYSLTAYLITLVLFMLLLVFL
jgi:hypothetical protein